MDMTSYHRRRPPPYYAQPYVDSKEPVSRGQMDTQSRRESVKSIRSSPNDINFGSRRLTINTLSYAGYSSGSILCGICRKEFDPSRPEALLAHLAAHFDLRYNFHRCQRCEINFVCESDLRRHLSSATRHHHCGYMFEHKQACSGHHPPRQRGSARTRSEDRRRYSLMRHSDDSRFDFCYRLRNWEQLQLQAHYQRRRPEPAPPKASFAVREARWLSLFDVCRLPFLHRSKSFSSLGSQAPILRNKPTAEQSEANELVVPKSDVLGAMLLRAVCTGNFELVASLLYAKANVHMEDAFGFGSMHYAARYASPEIVRLLARTGPYVNKTDDSGMSPLCHAVKIGRSDVAQCLLDLGAELRFDHLEHCVSTGDSDTAEVLLDHWTKGNRPLDSLDVLLLTATQTRDRDMIELLLEHGARALARDEAGRTAMSIASGRGDREIVQLLFDYGAEPGWSNVQSKMLSEVAQYRHIAMVEMLLSKGW